MRFLLTNTKDTMKNTNKINVNIDNGENDVFRLDETLANDILEELGVISS